MRRLRVLLLMHEELLPPETLMSLPPRERVLVTMEYNVLRALRGLGHEVLPLGVRNDLEPIRRAIRDWKPHITFNLLMHFHGIGRYDGYVVSYLELQRCPYTGCNPHGLMLANDKVLSKKVLAWHGIPVPRFAAFERGRAVRLPRQLRFPLFVKSAAEHASAGIAQASIVHDPDALRRRVAFIHRSVGTAALAEEYIEGRELYVSLLGNQRVQAFPIWEMTFRKLPSGAAPIATSKIKWDPEHTKRLGVRTGPARELSEAKGREITRIAKRIYRALDLSGFARIDLRLTPEGRIYVLEANPNPDLCRREDFARAARASGIAYPELIQRLLGLGLRWSKRWEEG